MVERKTTFKVGDRVEVLNDVGTHAVKGDKGTIVGIILDDPSIYYYINVLVDGGNGDFDVFVPEELKLLDSEIFNKIVDEYYGW